jgi:hypothetical protein
VRRTIKKKLICDVCNELVVNVTSHRQKRHSQCAIEVTGHFNLANEFRYALEKYEAKVRPKLEAQVIRWNKSMGPAELKKRFPDIYEKEFANN